MPPSFRATDHNEGQLIADKYRLLRRLGEGGMASVWVAHNEALDIEVAIKFIRADLQHPGLTSRLLQEARAAARLGNPAIVRVSDFGKDENAQPYIVMELLNGEDLSKVVASRGAVAPVRAVRLLLPIAHALATAHDKGIVHRDLKPENIFLHQREGGGIQPKLVDFGIAKLKRDDEQRITQLGSAMGSPAYMSPEQARGLDVDARADIWAYSVVLYEVMTGKLPFDGPTYAALLCGILEKQPTPITELGVVDPQLWALISRGLEKEPDRRWESMRELGTALAHWLQSRGVADDITGSSLISTWIDPQPDSERPMQPSLPGIPPLEAEQRSSLAQSVGDGATQLSFHDGVPAPAPRKRSFVSVAALVGGVGVLLIGAVVLFLTTRTRPVAEPPAQAAPAAAQPDTDLQPLATAVAQPSVEPTDSAQPAVPPSADPAKAEPVKSPPKPPTKSTAAAATAKPASTAKTGQTPPAKATAAAPKPKQPEAAGELDIKTTM